MPVSIRGKSYLTVAERVTKLHKGRPKQASITTKIMQLNERFVLMRATLTIRHADSEQRQTFTGHAIEFHDTKNQRAVNFASAVENCETSAIGRALAAAGYAGSEFASANEMENVQGKGQRRAAQVKTSAAAKAPRPLSTEEDEVLKNLPF